MAKSKVNVIASEASCGRCGGTIELHWPYMGGSSEEKQKVEAKKAELLFGWLKDHKCRTEDDD